MVTHCQNGPTSRSARLAFIYTFLVACETSPAGIVAITPPESGTGLARAEMMMKAVGCTPLTARYQGSSITVTDWEGSTATFVCHGLSPDSLFAVATRVQGYLSLNGSGVPAATAGYWGFVLKVREYCSVNLETGDVAFCGVFIPYYAAEWFGEEEQTPFDEFWDSGAGGPGGGGGGDAPIDLKPKSDCDQNIDKLCLKRMSPADRNRIQIAFSAHQRLSEEITDPVARERCETLRSALEYVLFTDPNASDSTAILHVGQTNAAHGGQGTQATAGNSGKAHVDPRYFLRATNPAGERELLEKVLHELGHSYVGVQHHNATIGARNNPNLPPNYIDDNYFREIHSRDPANSCIRWS